MRRGPLSPSEAARLRRQASQLVTDSGAPTAKPRVQKSAGKAPNGPTGPGASCPDGTSGTAAEHTKEQSKHKATLTFHDADGREHTVDADAALRALDGAALFSDLREERKPKMDTTQISPAQKNDLRGLVEELDEIQKKKDDAALEEKAVYAAAKAKGWNTKSLKDVMKHRRKNITEGEREDARALFDLYWDILEEGK